MDKIHTNAALTGSIVLWITGPDSDANSSNYCWTEQAKGFSLCPQKDKLLEVKHLVSCLNNITNNNLKTTSLKEIL